MMPLPTARRRVPLDLGRAHRCCALCLVCRFLRRRLSATFRLRSGPQGPGSCGRQGTAQSCGHPRRSASSLLRRASPLPLAPRICCTLAWRVPSTLRAFRHLPGPSRLPSPTKSVPSVGQRRTSSTCRIPSTGPTWPVARPAAQPLCLRMARRRRRLWPQRRPRLCSATSRAPASWRSSPPWPAPGLSCPPPRSHWPRRMTRAISPLQPRRTLLASGRCSGRAFSLGLPRC
mmetsp:Transcript_1268/g.4980  ORF Transcript_1268/g.4980 Transcript_1268/m.4980 type:complete len:231 (-) Transcript_1268:2633-3325(-)